MSDTLTSNLGIPVLTGNMIVSKTGINNALKRIDNAVLPIEHADKAVHWEGWKPGKEYSLSDVIKLDKMPSWGYLECTTAGISGELAPSTPFAPLDLVNDGTVQWTLRQIGGKVSHKELNGRNLPNQHIIESVTGLTEALELKANTVDVAKSITDAKTEVNKYADDGIANLKKEVDLKATTEYVNTQDDETLATSKLYTDGAINDLKGGADSAYDTLKEIENILKDDENVVSGILTTLSTKVDKVDGKGLSTNDYSNTEKAKLGKFGEVGNKLTYNGYTVTGGATTWAAEKLYSIDELVVHHNLLYKCKSDHTSIETFDESKWELVDIGYIAIWQTNVAYERFTVVTRGNNIIRCLTPHTSADFGNVEKNYWEVLAGKGATLSDWQPNTDYELNEAVVYNFIIYKSTAAHRSSSIFSNDMLAGMEKWIAINGYSAAGSLRQVTKLGVVAPLVTDIIINYTTTFNLPPVEILKFAPGLQDQLLTECKFDNSDATNFTVDGISGELSSWIVWDGTLKPRTIYPLAFSEPVTLSTGKTSESEWIDFSIYQSIASINV